MAKAHQPSTDEKVELLAQVPLFAALSPDQRRHLLDRARTRTLPARAVVVQEGDLASSLFVVAEGSVKVFLTGNDGEEISLGTLARASVVGELALLDQRPRSASIRTLEPTVLIEIGRDAVEAAVEASPELALMMMRHLAAMLRGANAQIRTLSLPSADIRILRALVALAGARAATDRADLLVSPKPTNQQIAERVACRPETVSRAMKNLRDARLLADDPNGVRITRRALETHADDLSDLF